jgi:hypothetical protein
MTQERREYDTGAVRSADCEQTRYDLISPIGLERLARTYAEGAEKFGAFNWENGMPVNDLLNHAIAHVYKFLGGDRSEDHLAHAAWNLLGAIHSIELWPELNEGTLRGSGCTCPPVALTQPAGKDVEDEIDVKEISRGVYAVTMPQAAPAQCASSLERLKRAVLGGAE